MSNIATISNQIWNVADRLRGAYKATEYGHTMLPFMTLCRLDSVLQEENANGVTKQNEAKDLANQFSSLSPQDLATLIMTKIDVPYYNLSNYRFESLLKDEANIEANFQAYLDGFSEEVKEILDNFTFKPTVSKLVKNNLLFTIIKEFALMNLSPKVVSNIEMGNIFEELLRKFSEMTNETAGEHYTPRSIINLCVALAVQMDEELNASQAVKKIYDPTCGTAGMLTVADDVLKQMHPDMITELYGQELNEESYAIAKADLLLKGYDSRRIHLGNTLSDDRLPELKADYGIANPPYGTSWKGDESFVKAEAARGGGRFDAGTPNVGDGQLLFVQHLIHKLNAQGRAAIVLSGSPLINGDAGSGESNIRKWIIDNEWLVAIIKLPTDMFYRTNIGTYIWIIDKHKENKRKGKVQFIDASAQFFKMKKSLGDKRNDMSEDNIEWIKKLYSEFDKANPEFSKVVSNEDLMFRKVTVDVPKVDENGNHIKDKKGKTAVDKSKRDTEKVPFTEDIEEYMKREVKPHSPNATWDEGKIGAEFPVDQYFYKYEPLPSTEEIETELNASVSKIQNLMKEIFE
jgi:type I restriction enzyme M protein